MATMHKCDKCEKIFSSTDHDGNNWRGPYKIKWGQIGSNLDNLEGADLCPKCSQELIDWFYGDRKLKKAKKHD